VQTIIDIIVYLEILESYSEVRKQMFQIFQKSVYIYSIKFVIII